MDQVQLNHALFEIVLNIGTSFDLKENVNCALSSYLQQLDCAGVILCEKRKNRFHLHTAKPRILQKNEKILNIIEDISNNIDKLNEDYFKKDIPYKFNDNDTFYCVCELEDFGVLIFVQNSRAYNEHIYKMLRPIHEKFTHSLIACRNIEKDKEKDKYLAQQSKMAAIGEMIDSIAHQWIQPLSVVNLELISLELDLELNVVTNQKVYKTVQSGKKQIQHLTDTINEFRSFFRPDMETDDICIKDLIESTLLLTKNDLLKHEVVPKITGELNTVINVNITQFKHVLINLINNAKDAFIENEIKNRVITFDIQTKQDKTILTITDNAGGIEPDIIEQIFEPHFTTKKDKGTGIGLYMTKQIVEKIGATIEVANIDDGVCFTITMQ